MLAFDAAVARGGLAEGGRWAVARYAGRCAVEGESHVPKHGPALLAGNHPGMVDAMAVWSALPRDDVRVIAAPRELLGHLPEVSRYLIPVSPSTLRSALEHLRAGGLLMTYPAGQIEPDPALDPGAAQTGLARWSSSVAALLERVPQCVLVPVAVSGVINPKAARHPWLRRFTDRKDRDWAAATLQVVVPSYRRVAVRVRFGSPMRSGSSCAATQLELTQQMARLYRD